MAATTGPWRSSAPASTSAPAGAASTWAPRRSGTPGSRSGSPGSAASASTGATSDAGVAEATEIGDPQARYLGAIMRSCGEVAARVGDAVAQGFLPLVLGGDHSVAMGTLGGMAKRARRRRRALDRRARRHEPAGHLAERQRPRDAARRGARRRGPGVRDRRLAVAVGRSGRRSSARARSTTASGPDRGARRPRLHDERHRPARHRARHARGARVPAGRRLRPRERRPRRRRPDVRAGRRHARPRRALLPRGPPRARARRRVGAARLARARRGQPDPRRGERDGAHSPSSSPPAPSAPGSSDASSPFPDGV